MSRDEIIGAVARGWCHPVNEHKQMDADLAYAIVDEIEKLNEIEQPMLGLATTLQLLEELTARAEIGGYAQYRTVDS